MRRLRAWVLKYRQLLAYALLVVLVLGVFARIEQVAAQDRLRNCETQAANAKAIRDVVAVAAPPITPPPEATPEQLDRIAGANAARAKFREAVDKTLPPIQCSSD